MLSNSFTQKNSFRTQMFWHLKIFLSQRFENVLGKIVDKKKNVGP